MADTYSLSVLAVPAGYTGFLKDVTLGDSAGVIGAQQNAMQNNTQILCKGPDGGLRWYTLDSSRSTPANPIILLVGP